MLKVILCKSKEITEDFKMDRIQVERNQPSSKESHGTYDTASIKVKSMIKT